MSKSLERLLELMARLRSPDGCPWDREQTFATIAPHTIEEAFEVADAIGRADLPALKDELGDLLFQVVFHARMAEEAGAFDFDAVAAAIVAKMISRHPHVFGDAVVHDADAQTRRWEEHKAAERRARAEAEGRPPGVLDDVTLGLPALTRALKLQKRAATVGFDWTEPRDILDKIEEEVRELRAELAGDPTGAERAAMRARVTDELGDVLFVLVNLARHLEIDPEAALRSTNDKFVRRFRYIERELAARGSTLGAATLDEMEALWQAAKHDEPGRRFPGGSSG